MGARQQDPHRIEVALVRTARSVRRAFNARLEEVGITMAEGALLSYVAEDGPLTQRELADLLHVSRASAGSSIDRLEAQGLLERSADPADRRVWRITLTDEAGPVLADFRAIDRDLRRDLRIGFDRSERQLLAQLLDRLRDNADAAAAATTATGVAS